MTTDAAHLDAEMRRRAVDPECSFIVQAPAGSGKTTLLTLRYLRLLATVDCPEQIVAITFTRKAATEMRHRILAALAAAAKPPTPEAKPHELEIHRNASLALARSRDRGWGLEHNPARLHVQTIDGLNHWLARRLPLAARIGTSATLIDDARSLYAEAARRTVARLDNEDPVAPRLDRLVRALNHEPQLLARLIEEMLGARELWLPKLLTSGDGPALRASIDRLLESAIEAELGRVSQIVAAAGAQPLIELIREVAAAGPGDGPLAALAGIEGLPALAVAAVSQWCALANLLLKAPPSGELRKTVDRRQGFLAAGEGAGWAARKQRMKALLAAFAAQEGFAAALAALRFLPPASLTDRQWERIDALTEVLPYAVAELLALFYERDSLDHPAVAAAARDALGHESSPTELALALDYRIRHLLVDEYQDTSPSQERLLELLVAGWQPGDGRSLFCVGDPMQSIYAFREADVTLFLQAQRQGIGGVQLASELLGQNFRSCRAIVRWVNETFAARMPAADDFERGAVRYSAATAVHEDAAMDGVTVHALLDADEHAMAAAVSNIAAAALQAEPGAARPTVAVLVRGRSSLPPLLAALRKAGVEYRGVELESLPDRPAIRDLVALAKAMLHPGDRTSWLAVLRAPWCGLTLADLLALVGDDSRALVPLRIGDPAVLARLSRDGAARLACLQQRLETALAGRGQRSLGSWVKSAWLALAGPATVGDLSDLANAGLLFAALDRLELETGGSPEASTIDAAVEGVMASPVGSDSAQLQVMTIHRAKGLEFDVVIVPDLQRGVRHRERPLLYWTQVATGADRRGIVLASRAEPGDFDGAADPLEQWMRHLADERESLELGRVAYVAATRAKHKLHLVGSMKVKWKDGEPQLRKAPGSSLLGFFWPALRQHFERALAACTAGGEGATSRTSGRRRLTAPPLLRLPADFVAPAPAAPPQTAGLRIAGETEGSIRPEFDWAGAIAQAVGQVVHVELHRLVQAGRAPGALKPERAAWRRLLRELGIDDAHLPEALARIEGAIINISRSEFAGRLLDPAAAEGTSELALTTYIDGIVQSLRIDRSYVDPEGRRWIVDWKTSSHEGGDIEAFLDNELARYTDQLRRYAMVMKRYDGRPQRVGLYFPLLDAWRELALQGPLDREGSAASAVGRSEGR
ncbi:MAG: UvrD-helicase domain-containing protein [Gammaproteobacteria bacterium]|nr:UvrD-helicase domain-containing protein [Gammaproteobacteria bacterium]